MRQIFKVKTRKEDLGRYINANNEKVTSTYEEIADCMTGALRWVKKIIYNKNENSSLPAWITQSSFYSKPQKINRVYKRKIPLHLEASLNQISKGFTPRNLADQHMQHQKKIQEKKRIQAIQSALQRRRILEEYQENKPKKIIQKFTITYIEDNKRSQEIDFLDRKITLALDLFRQEMDKKDLILAENKKQTIPNTKTTQNTHNLASVDKKAEKQENVKMNENNINIQPVLSPIEPQIKQQNKQEIVSKNNNNPFIAKCLKSIELSDLINDNKKSQQLFNTKHQILDKPQGQLSTNNNDQASKPLSNLLNQNKKESPFNFNNQLQQPTISAQNSVNNYPFPQNNTIFNRIYEDRNTNTSQFIPQNRQQNMQSKTMSLGNQLSFTNEVNPNLLVNGISNYFQCSNSKANQISLFGHDSRSQDSKRTQKKMIPSHRQKGGQRYV